MEKRSPPRQLHGEGRRRPFPSLVGGSPYSDKREKRGRKRKEGRQRRGKEERKKGEKREKDGERKRGKKRVIRRKKKREGERRQKKGKRGEERKERRRRKRTPPQINVFSLPSEVARVEEGSSGKTSEASCSRDSSKDFHQEARLK